MKKLIVAVLFFALATIASAQSFQTGEFSADVKSAGWSLHEGENNRSYDIDVSFKKSFEVIPKIILSVTKADCDVQDNIRYKVEARSISRDGFTIKISTWAASKVFGIDGSWLAISE